ncbi:MAG TPA: hypothetical protein VHG08_22305, partial [Longimicrobium sp.]|nr:hypothetical protein [Longimicrobium sp.]
RAFAGAGCAWLSAASRLEDVYADPAAAATLDAVSARHGVGWDGLAAANGAVPLSRIFAAPPAQPVDGTDFVLPVYQVFAEGASVATTPGVGDPVAVLSHPENTVLPLRPRTELVLPPTVYVVPADPAPPAQPPTLDGVAAAAGTTAARVAQAAANTPALLRAGFVFTAGGVQVPVAADRPDVTLAQVADAFAAAGVSVTPVAAAAANAGVPGMFRAGARLSIPRFAVVPADPAPPALPPTLAALARTLELTPESLARANAATRGLLRPGVVLTCNDVSVQVTEEHPDVSLDDVAATLVSEGVPWDGVMVAAANAGVAGLFRAGATLAFDRRLAADGESLDRNGSGVAAAALAAANTGVVNLFAAGTPLYTGFRDAGDWFDEPLAAVAGTWATPAEQILRHNRGVALAPVPAPPHDDLYLAIPGQAALPAAPAALRIPVAIPGDATLDGLAALFLDADPSAATPAVALAAANRALPGVLAGGRTITVGRQEVPTREGDSFADVLARFDPAVELADLVGAIHATPGFLAPGALLLAPPAVLGARSAPWTLAEAAARYGVLPADLAIASAALTGVVAPGTALSMPRGDGTTATVVTGAADTFNGIAWRFGEEHCTVTPAQVAEGNPEVPLLAPGAVLLLPPPAARLTAPVGATDAGWRFADTVFPLHAWVQIARAAALVDEAFRGTAAEPGPAVRDRASLPPLPRPGTEPGDRALAMREFARGLQEAVPALRAATGKVRSEEARAAPADVWAVAFGAGYVSSVRVAPTVAVPGLPDRIPQYFALRPLQNTRVSRANVPIQPLREDGTLGPAAAADFQGVDAEAWAQRFLSDVDLFLTAAYAAPAYRTPKRACLHDVLAAKRTLASGIAGGLDYVLELGQPDPARQPQPPADWASACETLRQRLLVSLSGGYGTDVVVQYGAAAASAGNAARARLSGAGVLPARPEGEQKRVSVSSAKTSLAAGGSYVNFLVDVGEDGRQRSVDLPLTYAVNEVEFNLTPVVDGYDASDWLSLVLPFGPALPPGVTVALGTPAAPLPLRAYPPLPALLAQEAAPTTPGAATYGEALRWDYAFTYQHQGMAPDQLRLEVDFNQTPLLQAEGAEGDDLFAALAQYVAVAPGLWAILQALQAGGDLAGQTLGNAMETFAALVGRVAGLWGPHWTGAPRLSARAAPAGGPVPETYQFTQTLDAAWNDAAARWEYTSLTLVRDRADGSVGWPRMGIFAPGGPVRPLGEGVDTPAGRRYDFPAGVEAFTLLGFEMRFGGLHVASHQNGSAQVRVLRNARLLGPALPPTRAGFVYQTQALAFPAPATPLLSWDRAFPIGAWTPDAGTNPLAAVFAEMFGGSAAGRQVSAAIRYGYELGGSPAAPIVTYLPVAYRPRFEYTSATVQEVIDRVARWEGIYDPAPGGGEWVFGLSLYSSVDGQRDRPLLELLHLASPITQVGEPDPGQG